MSAQPPERRSIPRAELTDTEAARLIGAAAQAYDYENRPRDRNWTPVPLDQAIRLVTGALGAMELDDEVQEPRPATEAMHLMTLDMGAWCGATQDGPGIFRASSQWHDVTCPACTAKRTEWLLALVWDMLDGMGPSREALSFAVRAGRLGVTDEQGRPLAMACAPEGAVFGPYAAGAPRDHDDPAEREDVLRMRREMAREAGDDSPGGEL